MFSQAVAGAFDLDHGGVVQEPVEQHEEWLAGSRYLNMDLLAEQKREQLREAA